VCSSKNIAKFHRLPQHAGLNTHLRKTLFELKNAVRTTQ